MIEGLEITCDSTPVQIEGFVSPNHYLYFRARGDQWTISTGRNAQEALNNPVASDLYANAGYMPHEYAFALIAYFLSEVQVESDWTTE